jgi:MFS family permease
MRSPTPPRTTLRPGTRTGARPTLFTPAFTTLALASLAYFTGVGILIPALPRYVAGPLAGSNVAVGLVVGAFSVSAVLARPVAGQIGDRRGRRPLMLAGATLFAVSVVTYGFATTSTGLAGLRLLSGAGEALFFVGAVTSFTDLAPAERRGEAVSLASLALYLGIGIGPLLAEAVLARHGFAPVWLLAAATAVVAALLVLRVPETRSDPVGTASSPRRVVHPAGLVPGVVLFTSIVGMAGFLAFVPLHALEIGMGTSGPALVAFAGTVVAIRSLGARLPDVLGAARAIRWALSLSVAGLAIVALGPTPGGLLLGAIVLGVGIALLTPSVFALAVADVVPAERAQVVGTTSAFIDLAFGAGPVAMGFVAVSLGGPAAFLAGAGAAAAGLGLVVALQVGRPAATGRVGTGRRTHAGRANDPGRGLAPRAEGRTVPTVTEP